MTEHRTAEERISLWLEEEAAGQIPDYVLEATFDRTRAIRHRPGPSAWRPFTMSRPISALIAVGAAAIVIAIGASVLRPSSQSNVVGGSSSPVAPSAALPTSTPLASVAAPSKPLGIAIVQLDGTVRQDLGLPRNAWAPAMAPDGSRIAYVSSGKLWISGVAPGSAPVDTGTSVAGRIAQFGTFPADAALAWSPDGTRLAYVSDGDVYVLGVDGTSSPKRLTTAPSIDEWPAWSPDGRTIYYINQGATDLDDSAISPTQELWRVPATGGAPKRITHDDGSELQPDLGHDGSMLIWVNGSISAIDPSNGRTTNVRNTGDGAVISMPDSWNPRMSPDGSKIAILSFRGDRAAPFDPSLGIPFDLPAMDVVVVDVKTGISSTVGPRVAAFWNPVSWLPDGSALLINRFDDGS